MAMEEIMSRKRKSVGVAYCPSAIKRRIMKINPEAEEAAGAADQGQDESRVLREYSSLIKYIRS